MTPGFSVTVTNPEMAVVSGSGMVVRTRREER